jgi:Zn-finger nucleic acid-binding protein
MSERQGVEIDYCPQCRGVWLDRGELDKIIERSTQEAPRSMPAPQAGNHYQNRPHHKRRKSFLEELFD